MQSRANCPEEGANGGTAESKSQVISREISRFLQTDPKPVLRRIAIASPSHAGVCAALPLRTKIMMQVKTEPRGDPELVPARHEIQPNEML